MNVTRRTLLGTAAACLSAGPGFQALAQSDWPSRPVRLISPYGAGGANDISARILAEQLERRLGQQFIVENKPGAGTRIANEFVARARRTATPCSTRPRRLRRPKRCTAS